MSKLAYIPLLFLVACLMAGVYGMIHNQISYTVAPEYFTQFKFYQFQIPEALPDRIGAAIVGWNAAWWMGLLVGIVLIPLGLIIPGNAQTYAVKMLQVFAVVTLTVLIVGLIALGLSMFLLDQEVVGEINVRGREIQDDLNFMRAGTMHNFSYLGGLIGLMAGVIAIFRIRRRQLRLVTRVEHQN